MLVTNNVNATTLPDSRTVAEDGAHTMIANAFQLPTAPSLTANVWGAGLVVGWVSPSPGFVLQQANELVNGTNKWMDATNAPWFAGESNIVTLPLSPGALHVFFRARRQ